MLKVQRDLLDDVSSTQSPSTHANEPRMTSMDVELRCPRCGSTQIGPKGHADTKTLGRVRCLLCKSCKTRFREKYARNIQRISLPPNLLEQYFMTTSLTGLRQLLNISCSEKTLHRWLVNQLRNHVTWEDFLPTAAKHMKFSHVMGIDTTNLRIRNKIYYYLHVVDFPYHHLAFEILQNEGAESIKAVLLKVKELVAYAPTVIVTDLAQELLCAIKSVHPTAIVQGCLFHLRQWLEKQLPTKKLTNPAKAQEWNSVKSLIMRVALSMTSKEKEEHMRELTCKLLSPSLDAKAKSVIKSFLRSAHFYHPLAELMIYGCKAEWRYNNACERAMEAIKDLSRKMRGFKNPEFARKYVNAMWIINMTKKMETNVADVKEEKGSLTLPLTLFTYGCYVDLDELSRAHNIGTDMLIGRLEKAGYIVVGKIAFAKAYAEMALEKVLKERPRTLYEFASVVNIDYQYSATLAEAIGLRLAYVSMDPRTIIIKYGRE